jgi:hypothetical protein
MESEQEDSRRRNSRNLWKKKTHSHKIENSKVIVKEANDTYMRYRSVDLRGHFTAQFFYSASQFFLRCREFATEDDQIALE